MYMCNNYNLRMYTIYMRLICIFQRDYVYMLI